MLLCCMDTIKDVFIAYRQSLYKVYVPDEIESITLLTINEICYLSKSKIKAFPELKLSESEAEQLTHVLSELKKGKPIQYILGKTEFYGLPFFVDPSVLIPRQETEEIIKWVIDSVNSRMVAVNGTQLAAGSILDIGTGSGCIAISLKKNLPSFKVAALDISADALKTAKRNAKLNAVDVEFIETDILNQASTATHHSPLTANHSIIISNPPYVTETDKAQMHINVTGFEPHQALFVPENDPLIYYKAIVGFALENLAKNGLLFFEINESYGAEVVQLLADNQLKNIELRKDMNGRDRMIKASV